MEIAARLSEDQHADRFRVLMEWLYRGAEDAVIELLDQGKISKGYAVKVLDTTYHELNDVLESRGIRLGLSEEQAEESRETARSLRARK